MSSNCWKTSGGEGKGGEKERQGELGSGEMKKNIKLSQRVGEGTRGDSSRGFDERTEEDLLEIMEEMYCYLATFTAWWYSTRQLQRIWRDTWRWSFIHLCSACLRSCVASLSHGIDCLDVFGLEAATESRMPMQVEENMKRISSA